MRLHVILGRCVIVIGILGTSVWFVPGSDVSAAEKGKTPESSTLLECKMTFFLSGWSVFYRTARGSGTVRCNDGQSAKVRIAIKGGGLTVGKSDVVHGTGTFTGVRSFNELFGSYAQSEAHAGIARSGDVQALTKGNVSLALSGTGRGFDIGVNFGKFTIVRIK